MAHRLKFLRFLAAEMLRIVGLITESPNMHMEVAALGDKEQSVHFAT